MKFKADFIVLTLKKNLYNICCEYWIFL